MTIWTVIAETKGHHVTVGLRSFRDFKDAEDFAWKCRLFEDKNPRQLVYGSSAASERRHTKKLKDRVTNHPMGGDAGYFSNDYAIKQSELV